MQNEMINILILILGGAIGFGISYKLMGTPTWYKTIKHMNIDELAEFLFRYDYSSDVCERCGKDDAACGNAKDEHCIAKAKEFLNSEINYTK